MAVATPLSADAPLLVVTDVAARLVRRGLLAPGEAGAPLWLRARVLVFRHGPVVSEPPPGAWPLAARCDLVPVRALTALSGGPTFQPHR
jgi:hypothetical protein